MDGMGLGRDRTGQDGRMTRHARDTDGMRVQDIDVDNSGTVSKDELYKYMRTKNLPDNEIEVRPRPAPARPPGRQLSTKPAPVSQAANSRIRQSRASRTIQYRIFGYLLTGSVQAARPRQRRHHLVCMRNLCFRSLPFCIRFSHLTSACRASTHTHTLSLSFSLSVI